MFINTIDRIFSSLANDPSDELNMENYESGMSREGLMFRKNSN